MGDLPVTELIAVRHGETVWNAEGRQQGHLNSNLTELGQRQAEAIADRMAGETFAALYSSDLGRALCTAEAIARRTGHAIVPDVRLRERHLGIFQGLTFAEVRVRYPADYVRYESGDPDYVIPGGESKRERYERITKALEDVAGRHPGQRVVVVSHGGLLDSLFRYVLGIPIDQPRRCKLYNASINTVFLQAGKWQLGTWGDVHHLHGMGTIDDW